MKARHVVVIAGALAAMVLPGTAHAAGSDTSQIGSGSIRNVGLNGCLSAVYDADTDVSLVRVKPCDGGFTQVWLIEDLVVDAADGPTVTVRKNARECLQLIGDLPINGRLALRGCDRGNPYQIFRASEADWAARTWRVSNPPYGSWLKAYHEHEAPYVSLTKEWPGAFAEWEFVPAGA